ncbi:MAG: serine/threonine-protein kinase [Dehalococcoidia bacterium]
MNDAGLGMLGRYELRARLGRGGFATVYRAWDPRLRREVALKALSLDWSEDEDVVRRFLAEAQKLAALQHPNIVTVYELSDPSERPYFTMELIEGRSLAELLQHGGRLVLPHVVEIVARLADAIDTLHAARVVHRDVKTPNVMLSNSGRVVLMDLGIARDMTGPQTTAHSRLLLSPESAAPEQIQGRMAGPAADIYALGIITYQMLAGRPPFQGDTAALLYAHVHTLPPPLANLCPGLPPPVYAAVDAALRKDPAARPASAGAFARMLTGAAPAPTLDHGEDADRPMPPTGEAATRPWPPVAPTAAATAPAMRPPAAPAARPGSLHWAVAAGAVAAMVVLTILGAGLLRLRPGGTGSAVTAGAHLRRAAGRNLHAARGRQPAAGRRPAPTHPAGQRRAAPTDVRRLQGRPGGAGPHPGANG